MTAFVKNEETVTDVVAKEPKSRSTLCVRSVEELMKLINGEIQVIETFMVPRTICEIHSPTHEMKQIIPYVTFTSVDEASGRLMFMAYTRPVGGSEERLHGDTSIGFGGHMDELDDLEHSGQEERAMYPNMYFPTYMMTKENLVGSLYKAARREVFEELGQDAFKDLGITIDNIDMRVMVDSNPDSAGLVHTCISIVIDMPAVMLLRMKDLVVASKREIDNLRVTGIVMDAVSKGDMEVSLKGLEENLTTEQKFERWSTRIALTRVVMILNFIHQNTTFSQIFALAMQTASERLKDMQRLQAAEAQAEEEANLSKSTVLSDAQLEDKEEGERAFPPESSPEAPAEKQTEA